MGLKTKTNRRRDKEVKGHKIIANIKKKPERYKKQKSWIIQRKISKKDTVLEVGPGFGVLTLSISEKAGKVVAYEIEKKIKAEKSREKETYELKTHHLKNSKISAKEGLPLALRKIRSA